MNLIEALQKWNKVTNDGGKTVYTTNSEGTIVMHTNGAVFKPTLELFNSTGWVEYREPLILPRREEGTEYYYIDEYDDIVLAIDTDSWANEKHFDSYNYAPNVQLIKYIKDKQFIQRVCIVLNHLNKDNPNKETLIPDYIKDNYKEIIDRIKVYELSNNL